MKRSQKWDRFVLAAALVSLCLCPVPARADEPAGGDGTTWLSYCQSSDTNSLLRYVSRQQLKIEKDRPADLALPAALGEQVQVTRWTTPMDAAGFRRVALSRSAASDLCDQLVIDSNGDGRLDDETICQPHDQRQYGSGQGQTMFGPVAMHFDSEDGPILYHLNFTVYSSGLNEDYYVMATTACWYQGTVVLNDRPVTCQLIDYNANGTFNDVCDQQESSYASADRVRFTDNAEIEPMFAGRYVRDGQQLYEFSAAKDGAYVTIREAEGPATGFIKPQDGFYQVKVYGPQGSFVISKEDEQQVPVGRYKLASWQLQPTPVSGKQWQFTGAGFPEQSGVDVATDAVVELNLGGPWTAKLEDQVRNRQHTFNQVVIGRYGEHVNVAYADGSQPPAPRLRIVSDDGKYDKTFKFEYG
ncbi:MAG: hypothetical protein IT445_15940 [Phycisphaeraceae bacterium]|nr:hypothetical protein [Phycisphaeraceae bacterium]